MGKRKQKVGGSPNKSGSSNSDVEDYLEIFNWAFTKSEKDRERIISLQQSADNTVLDSAWPTSSKVPIAAFYEAVQKAVPLAMDYLFSSSNAIRLMPLEPSVTMDQVRKSEMALYDLVAYKMKLQRACIPTISDVFKCAVGFGIVEPFYISPPSSFQLTVSGTEGQRKTTRVMQVGEPKLSLRYRYLTPAQIVVTPDGSNFNGENPVSVAFFFDSYNDDEFRSMYDKAVIDGEKPMMLGSVEDIIAEARTNGFTSQTSIEDFIGKVGGISPKAIKPDSEQIPGRVPVLKVYDRFKRRHLWIANGTTIVFDRIDEYQTLRCPLVKATAWMDANRFYPMSSPEAFQKIGWTKNVVVNMFLDIFTQNLKRPIVYNAELFDKEPTFGPDDKIRTSSPDARMGAAYLEAARIDPSSFTFYEMVNNIGNSLTGQRDYMEKNFTRGGGNAFSELLSTTEGMNRLQNSILEFTFLETTINQALIFLQTTVGEQGVTVRQRVTNKVTNKDEIVDVSVTEDDLAHGYELSLDLASKKRKGGLEQQMSLAVYDRKKDNPFFDQWEVCADHLCNSDEEVRRQLKSREEVASIQKQNDAMKAEAQALSNAKGAQALAPEQVKPPEGALPEMGV